MISYDTVDAKDLLQEGQSSGFRVFGTGGTGDHSLGLGASAFGRTENLDGIVAWSSRDRGDLRQSNGETAPNDESINNMLAKGTWQIDSAQSLSGLVRYYNNDAREPKIRRPLKLLIAATRWSIVQQFNAMRSFLYKPPRRVTTG